MGEELAANGKSRDIYMKKACSVCGSSAVFFCLLEIDGLGGRSV